jgi:hypothetical protein
MLGDAITGAHAWFLFVPIGVADQRWRKRFVTSRRPWSPTLSPDHPSDEDLSLGTPENRKDGARKVCCF